MKISLVKVMPRVIAVAAVGYCMWPSLADLVWHYRPVTPLKPLEFAQEMLTPAPTNASQRNPFLSEAAQAALAEARKTLQAQGGAAGGLFSQMANIEAMQGMLSNPNAYGKGAAAANAAPADPFSGLRLNATCIMGSTRLALINGKIYGVGDTITTENDTNGQVSKTKLTVVSVSPYKVMLECNGDMRDLVYSDTAAPPPSKMLAGGGNSGGGSNAAGNSLTKSLLGRLRGISANPSELRGVAESLSGK